MASKLAIHGGTRVVPEGMVKPWPHITEEDRRAVLEVLEAGDMAKQRTIQAESLAKEWAEYLGVQYAVPCNSGTAALHMCVAGIGVEPGEEVICPAFTFWATAAAVLHHNAIPVFVDVDPVTFTMDPSQIEARITPRTRALLPVHIHGMPADMDPIMEIAKKHGLAVIEDGAQAHGARYKGKLVGTFGDAAGFSLQMSKNLTTGSEGGLFNTNDEIICKRARLLQYLGEIVIPGRERQDQQYNAYGLGWVYRPATLEEAFVRSQLKRLDANNAVRRSNAELLSQLLANVPGVETPVTPEGRDPVYYTYTVCFKPEELGLDVEPRVFRDKMIKALSAEGVQNGLWQRMPVPAQEIFQTKAGYGKGCPWTCPHAGEVEYRLEDYPVSRQFIDSRIYVHGHWPPNGPELMRLYAEAFHKVMSDPGGIMKIEVE